MNTDSIRVLIVDDSVFIRNSLIGMLSKSPGIEVVGSAHNGEEALQKVEELAPDVMTLDIEMPGMNGLQVLEVVMRRRPFPIIMVSSLTEDAAKETFRALELGAVDFISKQLNGSLLEISKIEDLLVSKVKAAARWGKKIRGVTDEKINAEKKKNLSSLRSRKRNLGLRADLATGDVSPTAVDRLLIIGSSTGGPKAIQEILEEFPPVLSCGIIVVQHMPKFFTKPFADRLNQLCPVSVGEAQEGSHVEAGKVFIAPGSQHLRLTSLSSGQVVMRVSTDPVHLPYRPSVDLAMESAANIFGCSVLGVVLTGMGNDGEVGMRAIKAAGGCTLAQDEETCIVYGMPKAVIDAGHADAVVPISHMSSEILHRLEQMPRWNLRTPMNVHG